MLKGELGMAKHIIPEVPYIYQGSVPSCHETTLRMVLEFYGLRYSSSYVMNLSGFNYGFKYFKEAYFAIACSESPLGPWPFMTYAAEKLGCSINLIKHKPWDETWKLMKDYVDKDTPVYMPMLNMQHLWKTSFPVPHIVLLCGYDEAKGIVMIHDPALGEDGEGIQYLPIQYFPSEEPLEGDLYQGKSGGYAEFRIDDFRKACDLTGTPWQAFWKNGVAIISPPCSDQPPIPWAEVIERNGKLTLGLMREVVGKELDNDQTYGPDGIAQLASDVEKGFGLVEQPEALIGVLDLLKGMTFQLGGAYKKDGQAFLAGLAAATNNQDLKKASFYLRVTANCYDQGFAEIDHIMKKRPGPVQISGKLKRIAEILRRVAECETEAGERLRGAAQNLD
jgi:hypothetical protein